MAYAGGDTEEMGLAGFETTETLGDAYTEKFFLEWHKIADDHYVPSLDQYENRAPQHQAMVAKYVTFFGYMHFDVDGAPMYADDAIQHPTGKNQPSRAHSISVMVESVERDAVLEYIRNEIEDASTRSTAISDLSKPTKKGKWHEKAKHSAAYWRHLASRVYTPKEGECELRQARAEMRTEERAAAKNILISMKDEKGKSENAAHQTWLVEQMQEPERVFGLLQLVHVDHEAERSRLLATAVDAHAQNVAEYEKLTQKGQTEILAPAEVTRLSELIMFYGVTEDKEI